VKLVHLVGFIIKKIVIDTRLSIGNKHGEVAGATGKLAKTVFPAMRSFRQHFPNSHRQV